ncbi:MmcQ/YjbR family DNA-binding protein [Shimazuella kribbensis]|uniref:MmcQ/YjbR family DNA-binding protein n=1 Tax=Shimazuella kribbensis TaxID=139808 RepID=UPI0003FD0F74|nr:MmcQ/YjbR family DNA-binding protein [Shimazuella kribbensis]
MDLQEIEEILQNIRKICLELPETEEQLDGFGYTTFQVHGKSFVKITERSGVCFKSNKENQALLIENDKYFITPYIGRHGWVSIRDPKEGDWMELTDLIQEAYLRAAPKRLVEDWMKLHRKESIL